MGKKQEPRVALVTPLKQQDKATVAMKTTSQVKPSVKKGYSYSKFDQIDGTHPWKEQIPDGFINYPVRILNHGRVGFFNFRLAKEMGLIAKGHPEIFNEDLNQKIIETFSLQIINEYDQLNRRRFANSSIKKNEYMATRYLQLQHIDKTGKTSGDGRSIWNGCVQNNGKTWDVSSRGTGVTALAPGAVEAGRPLKSGSEEFGYGCGMAETDELYGTAIMSEVFYNQGINTERMLAIIDLGKGLGIGVRVGQNLLRPAHIFSHLKQSDHAAIVKSIDYFIDRQYQNGAWKFSTKHPKKYERVQEEFCKSYANFSALLDVDYIFAWIDWDGDNALADAGIIDYGSVRQFGLRFDQYRYDDVERFSTTLNEQKTKIEVLVQVFVQAVDFAKTGKRRSIDHYKDHHIVRLFQKRFEEDRLQRILYRIGFDDNNVKFLVSDHRKAVETFASEYDFIERKKTAEPIVKVSDGVNRQAAFNIRNLLRELPHFLATSANFELALFDKNDFFSILFADKLKAKDRVLSSATEAHARKFQSAYKDLIRKSKRKRSIHRMLTDVSVRSDRINSSTRITGNGIINVVEQILEAKKKGISPQDLHHVMQKFIFSQSLNPDREVRSKTVLLEANSKPKKLLTRLLEVVEDCGEDI